MAIMATESGTSSKKPGSDESRPRGAEAPLELPIREGETSKARPGARPGEVGKGSSDKTSHKAPDPDLDDLEDPYDNVACTD